MLQELVYPKQYLESMTQVITKWRKHRLLSEEKEKTEYSY